MLQVEALVQDRQQRKHKTDKYKNLSPQAIRRRQQRSLMRERRRAAQQTTKKRKAPASTNTAQPAKKHKSAHTTNYNMKCYLCGRYKNRCLCFTSGRGKEIAQSFQLKIFNQIPPKVKNSQIQTPQDTKDMTAYLRQMNHNMKFEFLWPTAFTWRHFSN